MIYQLTNPDLWPHRKLVKRLPNLADLYMALIGKILLLASTIYLWAKGKANIFTAGGKEWTYRAKVKNYFI